METTMADRNAQAGAVAADDERAALMERVLAGISGAEREGFRRRVEAALAEEDSASGELRYLKDLDIFLSMAGPAFMYSRGIAETLRVGEAIFELAYALRQARERGA